MYIWNPCRRVHICLAVCFVWFVCLSKGVVGALDAWIELRFVCLIMSYYIFFTSFFLPTCRWNWDSGCNSLSITVTLQDMTSYWHVYLCLDCWTLDSFDCWSAFPQFHSIEPVNEQFRTVGGHHKWRLEGGDLHWFCDTFNIKWKVIACAFCSQVKFHYDESGN